MAGNVGGPNKATAEHTAAANAPEKKDTPKADPTKGTNPKDPATLTTSDAILAANAGEPKDPTKPNLQLLKTVVSFEPGTILPRNYFPDPKWLVRSGAAVETDSPVTVDNLPEILPEPKEDSEAVLQNQLLRSQLANLPAEVAMAKTEADEQKAAADKSKSEADELRRQLSEQKEMLEKAAHENEQLRIQAKVNK